MKRLDEREHDAIRGVKLIQGKGDSRPRKVSSVTYPGRGLSKTKLKYYCRRECGYGCNEPMERHRPDAIVVIHWNRTRFVSIFSVCSVTLLKATSFSTS